MKKILTIALFAFSAMSFAVEPILKKISLSDSYIIPSMLTTDGLAKIAIPSYEESSNAYTISMYNDDLDLTETLSFAPDILQLRTLCEFGKMYSIPKDWRLCMYCDADTVMTRKSITIINSDGSESTKQSGITVDEVKNFYLSNIPAIKIIYEGNWEQYPEGGGQFRESKSENCDWIEFKDWKGTLFSTSVFRMDYTDRPVYFDIKTPDPASGFPDVFVLFYHPFVFINDFKLYYSNGTNVVMYYLTDTGEFYEVTFKKHTLCSNFILGEGLTDSIVTYPDSVVSKPLSFSVSNESEKLPSYTITFSQTLFNDDDKFEYLACDYGNIKNNITEEEDRNGNGTVDYRLTVQTCSPSGIKLKNTDGETLCIFEIPTDYNIDNVESIKVVILNKRRYLIATVSKGKHEWEKIYYRYIYRIDPETSSIEQVGAPMKARVAPTIVSRGEDITVDMPQNQGETDIMVTSMSGSTIMSRQMPQGGGQTTIATDRLQQGMHIVTLNDRDRGTSESTKVIVK